MVEHWKPVVGAEEFYEVSNFGRVKTLHRWGRPARNGLLAQTTNKKGYKRVGLLINKKRIPKLVHRLVLDAFVGPQPSSIHECNHKNGVKGDNHYKNLEWVTPKENNAHSVAHGYWHPHIGEKHGRAKIKEKDVPTIRLLEGRKSAADLAKKYGVSDSAIRLIWKRKNWKHVK